jgi:hypothetical protein
VVGTPRSVKNLFASALASKCGTLYLPWRVGIRLSSSAMCWRVSSNVDQMACWMPPAAAASAIVFACAVSFSAEKCSQKLVRQ